MLILIGTIQTEYGGDGDDRLRVIEAWFRGGPLPGSKYSFIQPLLTLPHVWLGKMLSFQPVQTAAYFNCIVLAALGAVIHVRLAKLTGQFFATLFCLFCLSASMMHVNIAFYYGEVLTAFTLLAGFLSLYSYPVQATVLIAIGVANNPAIGIPVAATVLAFRRRSWPIVCGAALAFAFFCAENYYKSGGVLATSYLSKAEHGLKTILPYSGIPGFSYPLALGVASTVFSFGKGILFFIPSIALAINHRYDTVFKDKPPYQFAMLLFSVAIVLVYSKWWAWYGGVFWGPRFFLTLVFVGALLFVQQLLSVNRSIDRWVLVLILALSTWVGIGAAVFRHMDITPLCEANGYRLESLCWYVPEFSPLFRPFIEYGLGGVIDRMSHRFVHSIVIWRIVVFAFFCFLIFSRKKPEGQKEAYS